MMVFERISQQAKLVSELIKELETEKSYRGIERLVQIIIQALLDLGLMVISALKGREPKAYSEVGYILHDLGVLEESDATLLKSMAGLRNILVHAYAAIDRGKIAEFSEKLKLDAPRIASTLTEKTRSKGIDPEENGENEVENIVNKLSKALQGKVKAAYLFGGRAKGYTLKGDYDVAILMKPNYTLHDLGTLQIQTAKALEVNEEKVDLLCLNTAPPNITIEALSGTPILEENPQETFNLKIKALTELLDLNESLKLATRKTAKQV